MKKPQESNESAADLSSSGAYQKARQLFDLVVADMETLKTNPTLLPGLVSQTDAVVRIPTLRQHL